MSFSFCAVNLKGIEGLLTSVSRCWRVCQRYNECIAELLEMHTTKSVSLRRCVVALSDRHWVRWNWRRACGAPRKRIGVSFEAMVSAGEEVVSLAAEDGGDVYDEAVGRISAARPISDGHN
jgi:hypothetical protein